MTETMAILGLLAGGVMGYGLGRYHEALRWTILLGWLRSSGRLRWPDYRAALDTHANISARVAELEALLSENDSQ